MVSIALAELSSKTCIGLSIERALLQADINHAFCTMFIVPSEERNQLQNISVAAAAADSVIYLLMQRQT